VKCVRSAGPCRARTGGSRTLYRIAPLHAAVAVTAFAPVCSHPAAPPLPSRGPHVGVGPGDVSGGGALDSGHAFSRQTSDLQLGPQTLCIGKRTEGGRSLEKLKVYW
jgi:hypothetical protein